MLGPGELNVLNPCHTPGSAETTDGDERGDVPVVEVKVDPVVQLRFDVGQQRSEVHHATNTTNDRIRR